MQTIMGIKAPAMIQRPAREQLQWPVQEVRIKVSCQASFILTVIRPFTHEHFLINAQIPSSKRPRGADNGRFVACLLLKFFT
jgi:hypothetical protein